MDVCKVISTKDIKVKFFNLDVNVVIYSKWWPVTEFLHTNQIFENLNLLLFLGGGGAWSVWKVTSMGYTKAKFCNLSINVFSDRHTKWR